jgi:radical SAM superfamily enzyme YgiQ (UPF0313 family)
VRDLDKLPWPDWELLNPAEYPDAPQGGFGKAFPMAPISVSRGCPMACTFCGGKSIYGDGFRTRKIDSVIDEIRMLQTRFGVREIMIQDDNLTYDKPLVLEFCRKIKPLAIDWNCLNGIRLNPVDEEIAFAMKDAGCYAVGVGIESGSQTILNDMRKGLTLEMIAEKINILKRNKIWITGLFIIGYPTETEEDVLKTIAFANSLPIEKAAYANFLPLPGSPVFDQLRTSGHLDDFDISHMSYYKASKSYSPHLTADDTNRLLRKATLSFYFRPKVLLRMMAQIGSLPNLLHILTRFARNYLFR